MAKKVYGILNQYLAAGLVQRSIFPYSSPLIVIPKKSGGVGITVNYAKLSQTSSFSQLPIPGVDQDSWARDLCFLCSTWFLRSIGLPRTRMLFFSRRFAFPRASYEWRFMPQGSNASPEWFVKVIIEIL